jgi:phosphatidate cytidylyltransferase
METALKNRLTYGPLMLLGLGLLLWLDSAAEHWTHGWVTDAAGRLHGVGGVGLLILLLLVLPMGMQEVAALFAAEKVRPYRLLAAAGSGLLVLHAFLTQWPWFQIIAASALAFIIVLEMLLAGLIRALMRQTQDAIHGMAGTILATLYLGGLGWFIMALRVKHSQPASWVQFNGSTQILLLILLVVKFTDIGAYFGGRALGRHKLIPWLSPGKTWEGLFCGLLTGALMGAACAHAIEAMAWWKGVVVGVTLGGVGQLGDLLESLMKRDAEVKDSGSLIPGFGGILDVIDSPLFASPFAYILFSFIRI